MLYASSIIPSRELRASAFGREEAKRVQRIFPQGFFLGSFSFTQQNTRCSLFILLSSFSQVSQCFWKYKGWGRVVVVWRINIRECPQRRNPGSRRLIAGFICLFLNVCVLVAYPDTYAQVRKRKSEIEDEECGRGRLLRWELYEGILSLEIAIFSYSVGK